MFNLVLRLGEFTLERPAKYFADIEEFVDVQYRLTDNDGTIFMLGYYNGLPCLLEREDRDSYTITWLNASVNDVYNKGVATRTIDPVKKQFVYSPSVFTKWRESITDKDQAIIDYLAGAKMNEHYFNIGWDSIAFMRTVLASNISKRVGLQEDMPIYTNFS